MMANVRLDPLPGWFWAVFPVVVLAGIVAGSFITALLLCEFC